MRRSSSADVDRWLTRSRVLLTPTEDRASAAIRAAWSCPSCISVKKTASGRSGAPISESRKPSRRRRGAPEVIAHARTESSDLPRVASNWAAPAARLRAPDRQSAEDISSIAASCRRGKPRTASWPALAFAGDCRTRRAAGESIEPRPRRDAIDRLRVGARGVPHRSASPVFGRLRPARRIAWLGCDYRIGRRRGPRSASSLPRDGLARPGELAEDQQDAATRYAPRCLKDVVEALRTCFARRREPSSARSIRRSWTPPASTSRRAGGQTLGALAA